MANVLLVNPPFYRLLNSHYNANSLGIAYVAAYLNSRGHNAWLYNADFLNSKTFLKQKTHETTSTFFIIAIICL